MDICRPAGLRDTQNCNSKTEEKKMSNAWQGGRSSTYNVKYSETKVWGNIYIKNEVTGTKNQ
jgi:hypothetical protein